MEAQGDAVEGSLHVEARCHGRAPHPENGKGPRTEAQDVPTKGQHVLGAHGESRDPYVAEDSLHDHGNPIPRRNAMGFGKVFEQERLIPVGRVGHTSFRQVHAVEGGGPWSGRDTMLPREARPWSAKGRRTPSTIRG